MKADQRLCLFSTAAKDFCMLQVKIPISRTSSNKILFFSGLARFHQKITVNFTRHNAFFHGQKICFVSATRDGILGHQFNKRLESFAPCYSQSLLLADFKRKPYSPLVLKILTKKIRETRKLESIHE
jgi:hypothetical protein